MVQAHLVGFNAAFEMGDDSGAATASTTAALSTFLDAAEGKGGDGAPVTSKSTSMTVPYRTSSDIPHKQEISVSTDMSPPASLKVYPTIQAAAIAPSLGAKYVPVSKAVANGESAAGSKSAAVTVAAEAMLLLSRGKSPSNPRTAPRRG